MDFLLISSVLLWVVVCFNLLLTIALIRRVSRLPLASSGNTSELLKPGTLAPAFTAKTFTNEESVALSTYSQQELLLIFVAPDCHYCHDRLGLIQDLRKQAKTIGAEVALVVIGDKSGAGVFARNLDDEFPILLTPPNDDFQANYRVQGTPSYCLIGADHKILASGALDNTGQKITSIWRSTSSADKLRTLMEGV